MVGSVALQMLLQLFLFADHLRQLLWLRRRERDREKESQCDLVAKSRRAIQYFIYTLSRGVLTACFSFFLSLSLFFSCFHLSSYFLHLPHISPNCFCCSSSSFGVFGVTYCSCCCRCRPTFGNCQTITLFLSLFFSLPLSLSLFSTLCKHAAQAQIQTNAFLPRSLDQLQLAQNCMQPLYVRLCVCVVVSAAVSVSVYLWLKKTVSQSASSPRLPFALGTWLSLESRFAALAAFGLA